MREKGGMRPILGTRRVLLLFSLAFLLTLFSAYAVDIAQCTTDAASPVQMNKSRVYELTNDIGTAADTCLVFQNHSATLDCKGFTVSSNGTSGDETIRVPSVRSNITMRNCVVSGPRTCFRALGGLTNFNIVSNFFTCGDRGVRLGGAHGNITNNSISSDNVSLIGGWSGVNISDNLMDSLDANAISGILTNSTIGFNTLTGGGFAAVVASFTAKNSTIVFNNITVDGNGSEGIEIVNGNNITIKHNAIDSTFDSGHGISIGADYGPVVIANNTVSVIANTNSPNGIDANMNLSRIENNTVHLVAITSTGRNGIRMGNVKDTEVHGNFVNVSGPFVRGILLDNIRRSNVTRNFINVSVASSESYGIHALSSHNWSISHNQVFNYGNSTANLVMASASNSTVFNNTFINFGPSLDQGFGPFPSEGISLENNFFNSFNLFINNTIQTYGNFSPAVGFGNSFENRFRNMRFIGNNISSFGNKSDAISVYSSFGNANNSFESNEIHALGAGSYVLNINSTNSSLFFNDTQMFTNAGWIRGNNFTLNVSNMTFNRPSGYINLVPKFEIETIFVLGYNSSLRHLNISPNFAFLDGSNIPEFNVSAKILLDNVGIVNPVALVDLDDDTVFQACGISRCSIPKPLRNGSTFNVTSFTAYKLGASGSLGTNLSIWDETDTPLPYTTGTKSTNEDVDFFANYTTEPGELPINTGTCNITFDGGPFDTMAYNATKALFEYNRSFATPGNKTWQVACTNPAGGLAAATDTVFIESGESIDIKKVANNTIQNLSQVIIFNITINNTGETNLTAINVTDVYNTSILSFTRASVTPDDPADDGQLNWTHLINLTNGTRFSLQINFTSKTIGFTNNTVNVSASGTQLLFDENASIIQIVDVTIPIITPLNCTANPSNLSQTVVCNATVQDNLAVDTVTAAVNRPELAGQGNDTLFFTAVPGSNNYTFNVTQTTVPGLYNVTWFANDTSDNQAIAKKDNFTINDVNPPTITGLTCPDVNASIPSNCSATITDDFVVMTVVANTTLPSGAVVTDIPTNVSTLYSWSIPETATIGLYNVSVFATDFSNNTRNLNTSFNVVDQVPPVIVPTCNPSTGAPNATINCSALITDNVEVDNVSANFTLPNGTTFNASLLSNYSFLVNQTELLGTYNVSWFANDTSSNNATAAASFKISLLQIDLLGCSPSRVNPGTQVNCSANVTTNSNISLVTANVTEPDSTNLVQAVGNTSATHSFVFTPTKVGVHNVTWFANDTDLNTEIKIDNFTANSAPSIVTAPSPTVLEDSSILVNLSNFTLTDPQGDPLVLFLVAQGPQVSCTQTNNATINITPTANFSGSTNCTVKVGDGLLNSTNVVMNITVQAVNDAPTINNPAIAPTPPVFTDTDLNGSATPQDIDNVSLTVFFNWSINGTTLVSAPVATLNNTLTNNILGNANFGKSDNVSLFVQAFDGESSQPSTIVSVIISNSLPTAPSVEIVPLPALENDTLVCNITVNSTDADNDLINYTFRWYNGSSLLRTFGPTQLTSDQLGAGNTSDGETWNCTVSPADDEGLGVNASATTVVGGVTINTLGCDPSKAHPPFTTQCNATVVAILGLDVVLANVTQPDGTVQQQTVGGNVSFSFNAVQSGLHNVTWFANDTFGTPTTASDNFTSNTAPTLAVPGQTVAEDNGSVLVNLTPFAGDVDGDNLTFNVVAQNQVSCTILGDLLNMTPALDFSGFTTCSVTADDTFANSTPSIVNITVNPTTNNVTTGSTIINSPVFNSTKIDNTIIDSEINHSVNYNSNITGSIELSSSVNDSTVTNATIVNSGVDPSTVINSTINNSVVTDSNVTNATLTNSTIDTSFVNNSVIIGSSVTGATVLNSSLNGSTISSSAVVQNAVILNEQLVSGTITFNGQTFTGPTSLSTIFSPPAAATAPAAGGGGGGGGGSGCQPNWECGDWSECGEQGVQSRTCADVNRCAENFREGLIFGAPQPDEEQACEFVAAEVVEPTAEEAELTIPPREEEPTPDVADREPFKLPTFVIPLILAVILLGVAAYEIAVHRQDISRSYGKFTSGLEKGKVRRSKQRQEAKRLSEEHRKSKARKRQRERRIAEAREEERDKKKQVAERKKEREELKEAKKELRLEPLTKLPRLAAPELRELRGSLADLRRALRKKDYYKGVKAYEKIYKSYRGAGKEAAKYHDEIAQLYEKLVNLGRRS